MASLGSMIPLRSLGRLLAYLINFTARIKRKPPLAKLETALIATALSGVPSTHSLAIPSASSVKDSHKGHLRS